MQMRRIFLGVQNKLDASALLRQLNTNVRLILKMTNVTFSLLC